MDKDNKSQDSNNNYGIYLLTISLKLSYYIYY